VAIHSPSLVITKDCSRECSNDRLFGFSLDSARDDKGVMTKA
jgi:hypothetical protein